MKNTLVEKKKLSFIVPAMNEENTILELYEGIKLSVERTGYDWEVIFIDDGSTDGTWDMMSDLALSRNGVKAFRFSMNRGKADALALGYSIAGGDIVFTMDADLQDDPKEIVRFLKKMDQGYDIVSGWKRRRHDPWHKVLPSRVFNAVLSWITGVSLHDHNCGFKAYRKEVVKSLPMYGDMHRMVPSLASFKGYRTVEIEVEHSPRRHGVSKYGWSRLAIGALDTITVAFLQRFRNCPMHFAGKISAALVTVAMCFFVGALVFSIVGHAAPTLFLVGFISLVTGVLVCIQGLMLEQQVYRSMENGRNLKVAESIDVDDAVPALEAVEEVGSGRKILIAG